MDIRKKYEWVQALYSGEYDQCQGVLKDINGRQESFCCLGVLCDISGEGEWEDHVEDEVGWGEFLLEGTTYGFTATLPSRLRVKYHLSNEQIDRLIKMNDNGYSFNEIGDWIRLNVGID